MTDRFKFRAWLIAYNKYIYDIQNVGCDFSIKCNEDCFGDFLGEDKYIVEQCTGLKDKNGKLIYEGDIVEYYNEKTEQYIKEKVLPFRELETKGILRHFISERNSNKLNIVGNIHENKELLDD